MNPIKQKGLKLFSLCALTLALVALGAATAQAEGTWMVKGVNLTSGSKELKGKLVAPGDKLLATLGGNNVAFSCTSGQLINAILETEGAISETSKNAKIKFSGCTTEINGKVSAACVPISGVEKGVMVTEEVFALLKSHELKDGKGELIAKDGVTVIIPKVGTTFIIFHMGESCAIGEELKVFGELALVDVGGNKGLQEEKVTHTVKAFAPLTALTIGTESKSNVTLDGEAEIELTAGEVWNGLQAGEQKSTKAVFGEGTATNPFELSAEILAITPEAGKGAILGGTCVVGNTYASLAACNFVQDAPVGATVSWRAN
jgi:hypothetical protein